MDIDLLKKLSKLPFGLKLTCVYQTHVATLSETGFFRSADIKKGEFTLFNETYNKERTFNITEVTEIKLPPAGKHLINLDDETNPIKPAAVLHNDLPLFASGAPHADEVNSKTGLLQAYTAIAELIANEGNGPTLQLGLHYHPFSPQGLKWTPQLAHGELTASLLTIFMPTGEVYYIDTSKVDTAFVTPKIKLDLIIDSRTSLPLQAKVTSNDGSAVTLEPIGPSIKRSSGSAYQHQYWLPTKLHNHLGRSLYVKWRTLPYDSTTPIIESISDDSIVLLKSEVTDVKGARTISYITLPTNAQRSKTTKLFIDGTILQKITRSDNHPFSTKQFIYDNSNLVKIVDPSGQTDTITYNQENQVTKHTRSGSANGELVENYSYEKSTAGNKTIRTLNLSADKKPQTIYHFDDEGRLITLTERLGTCSKSSSFSHIFDEKTNILSVETIVTYDNRSSTRKETSGSKFDVLGNLISTTELGITTDWTYYPGVANEESVLLRTYTKSDTTTVFGKFGWVLDNLNPIGWINGFFNTRGMSWGTLEDRVTVTKPLATENIKSSYNLPVDMGCPGDPNYFRVYVESKKVHTLKDGKRLDLEWTYYGYSILPVEDATVAGPAVKPSVKLTIVNPVSQDSIKLNAWPSMMIMENTDYYVDPADRAYGRVKRVCQRTLNVQGKEVNSSLTTSAYTYTFKGNQITTTTTFTAGAGVIDVSSVTTEAETGFITATEDTRGNVTSYTYDVAGRVLTQLESSKSSAKVSKTSFEYSAVVDKHFYILSTSPDGEQYRKRFNSLGKLIQIETRISASGPWLILTKISYDPLGRETNSTEFDYKYDQTQLISKQLNTAYDDWGNIAKQQISGGPAECFESDPVANVSFQWQESGSNISTKIKKHYDFQGRVDKQSRLDAKGNELNSVTYTYDVAGRLNTSKPSTGVATQYTYDIFDRVISVQHGNRTVKNEYPAYGPVDVATRATLESTPEHITYELGTRKVDSLGRVTETNIGGIKHKYTYEKNSPVGISNLIRDKRASSSFLVTNDSSFDSALGKTTHTTVGLAQKRSISSEVHSLRGLLLTSVDNFGCQTDYQYDTLGRITGHSGTHAKASFTYDGWGRLGGEKITDTRTNICVAVSYKYDEEGRETERAFDAPSLGNITCRQTYTEGRVATAELLTGNQSLRMEKFSYGVQGELATYECIGSHKPTDPISTKPLDRQVFTYDALGNISTCLTTTGNIKNTATYVYDTADETRLISIAHSNPSHPATYLEYNNFGELKRSPQAQHLLYTALGQLGDVILEGSEYQDCSYAYDSLGRIAGSYGTGFYENYYYKGDNQYGREGLYQTTSSAYNKALIQYNSSPSCIVQGNLIAYAGNPYTISSSFEFKDIHGSLIASYYPDHNSVSYFSYTPFGYRPATLSDHSWIGYNGEPLDLLTGTYHLGNGYRVYDPRTQRFQAPDSLSPFGEGGPNSYSYSNDPINFSDPSGHMQVSAQYTVWAAEPAMYNPIVRAVLFGGIGVVLAPFTGGASIGWTTATLGIAIVSAAFGIAAAATAESNPELSAGLEWASLGTGLVSAGVGFFGAKLAARSTMMISNRMASTVWRPEQAIARNMIERRGPLPVYMTAGVPVHGTAQGEAYTALSEFYSGGLDSRILFIDSHAIPRKGHFLRPLPRTEVQFRSGVGTTTSDFQTSWRERINSRTPYRYMPGDPEVPDYILMPYDIKHHIKGESLTTNFRQDLAIIAAETNADILRPLEDMRFSDILTTLEKEGFHYDRIVGNFCRGTIRSTNWGLIKHLRRSLKLF